jgi:hypothetical protein
MRKERQGDRQTDTTKLVVAFSNFVTTLEILPTAHPGCLSVLSRSENNSEYSLIEFK